MVHGVATATLPPVTPGLAYVLLDGLAVVPDDPSTHPRSNTGAGYTTTAAFRLDAPLVVPVGSQLKESSVAYQAPAPASSPALLIFRQPLDASLQMVGNVLLPESPAQSVATAQLNETVDGTSTYNLQFFVGFTNPTASVFAVRGGYLPPPQAFVPLSPSQRVLDTRVTARHAEHQRGARHHPRWRACLRPRRRHQPDRDGGTEGAGFVAVFPAGSSWPGNSSINWSGPDQSIANSVLSGIDAAGRITIRGGVNRTDVVIDVVGYLL